MQPTIGRMLAEPSFRLAPLASSDRLDDVLSWVSSSDLADPSPFLLPDQFILTTGQQFEGAPDAAFAEYVERLRDSGVVGIGFGTEVVASGTPPLLIEACRSLGMALVEVPYDVPFVAIITWAAQEIARESAARDEWALAAQQAVSIAGVSAGGISAALQETARQLDGTVLVYDSDGEFVEQHPASRLADEVADAVQADVRTLLSRGRRARAVQDVSGRSIVVQTLGGRGRPRGVIALVSASPLDAPARAVLMTATALVEVGRDRDAAEGAALAALGRHAMRLLERGDPDAATTLLAEAVRAGAGDAGRIDPTAPVIVLVAGGHSDGAGDVADRKGRTRGDQGGTGDESAAAEVRRVLRRTARTTVRTRLTAVLDGELVALASVDGEAWLRGAVEASGEDVVGGLSASHPLAEVAEALGEARAALAVAAARRRQAAAGAPERGGLMVSFGETSGGRLLEVLSGTALPAVARERLDRIRSTPEGTEALGLAALWFEHGCRWEAAAAAAGMHRHSLRTRVERLAARLDLDLDSFPDRAEFWALVSLA